MHPSPPPKLPTGHRPLPTLAALLPFILYLETALLFGGKDLIAARVVAHEQIGAALHFFGLSPVFVLHATGLVVVAVLLTWHGLTGARWKLNLLDPLKLLVEGVIAMAPLLAAAAFFGTMRDTPLAGGLIAPESTSDAVALAIGAGLSEELLFRMAGVALVHWVVVDLAKQSHTVGVFASVILTTIAFTWYHDPSLMPSAGIAFVAVAGLYLCTLYVLRGFAVAVIAHIGYDAVVLLAATSHAPSI